MRLRVLENSIITELVKKFHAAYGTRKFYHHVLRTQSLFSVLKQINPIHILAFHFLKINFNIILISMTKLLKWNFPLGFPIKTLYAYVISPLCFKCLTHLIYPELVTLLRYL